MKKRKRWGDEAKRDSITGCGWTALLVVVVAVWGAVGNECASIKWNIHRHKYKSEPKGRGRHGRSARRVRVGRRHWKWAGSGRWEVGSGQVHYRQHPARATHLIADKLVLWANRSQDFGKDTRGSTLTEFILDINLIVLERRTDTLKHKIISNNMLLPENNIIRILLNKFLEYFRNKCSENFKIKA